MTDLTTISVDACGYLLMTGDRCELPSGHDGAHEAFTAWGNLPVTQSDDPDTLRVSSTSLDDLARRVPYGVFGRTGRFNMSEFQIQTIAKPRHVRDGSVTDEQVDAVFEAFATGKVPDGEAVVICRGMDKENTARNRARTLAERVKERHGSKESYKPLAAHAIADPDAKDKFVGAVSLKPKPKPKKDTTPPASASKK